jgi:SAM-dependent methyltransferase
MAWIGRFLHTLGGLVHRAARFLDNLLPVFMSGQELSALIRNTYGLWYADHEVPLILPVEAYSPEAWETEVFDRYGIRSGRMLVLATGLGREAIAAALRGLQVVGVDSNAFAVHEAQRRACSFNAPVYFHQADFLAPPLRPGSFDYAYIADHMYCAVAGVSRRQAWVRNLCRLLRPDGLLVFNFAVQRHRLAPARIICDRVNQLLARLPGTNHEYQPGDTCEPGHFLHFFRHEDEIRRELEGAGMIIQELNWAGGYAVITASPPAACW